MSTKTDCPLLSAALEAVTSAHNATCIAEGCFADLAALFQAIADASGEYSQASKLAKIGKYLAEDWANLSDSTNEELEGLLNALRAGLGLSAIETRAGRPDVVGQERTDGGAK